MHRFLSQSFVNLKMFVGRLTEADIEENCTCAGIFMVNYENQNTKDLRILLVESKRKVFQYSFPKGKRNKGEPTIETAKREFHEETGLDEEHYDLFPNKFYIEYRSDTGKPHIVYYLGKMKEEFLQVPLNPIDTKEIVSARWYTPEEIYRMKKSFYLQRRQIVTRAVKDVMHGQQVNNILKNNACTTKSSTLEPSETSCTAREVTVTKTVHPS